MGCFGKDHISKHDFRKNCVFGKTVKTSFKTGIYRSNGILDYIHFDLWWPTRIT